MLVKLDNMMAINLKSIIQVVMFTDTKPAKTTGWWLWSKTTPEKIEYEVHINYVDMFDMKQGLTYAYKDRPSAEKKTAELIEVVMNLDQKYIDQAFENEILS